MTLQDTNDLKSISERAAVTMLQDVGPKGAKKVRKYLQMPMVRQMLEGSLSENHGIPDLVGGRNVIVSFEQEHEAEFVNNMCSGSVSPSIDNVLGMTTSATTTSKYESIPFLPSGGRGVGSMEPVKTPAHGGIHTFNDSQLTHTYLNRAGQITTATGTSLSVGLFYPSTEDGAVPATETIRSGTSRYLGTPAAANDVVFLYWDCPTSTAANVLGYVLTWNGSAVVNTPSVAVADDLGAVSIVLPASTTHLLEVGFRPSVTSTAVFNQINYTLDLTSGANHAIRAAHPVGGSNAITVDRVRSIGGPARMVSLWYIIKYAGGSLHGGRIGGFRTTEERVSLDTNYDDIKNHWGNYTGPFRKGLSGFWVPSMERDREFTSPTGYIGTGGCAFVILRDDVSQSATITIKGVIEIRTDLIPHGTQPMTTDLKQLQAMLFLAGHIPSHYSNNFHIGEMLQAIGKALSAVSPVVGAGISTLPIPGARVAGTAIGIGGPALAKAMEHIGVQLSAKQKKAVNAANNKHKQNRARVQRG